MVEQKIILKGIPASPGIVNGKAKIILDYIECHKMKNGDILVTLETNPQYAIALMKAKGVITERGGMLSHAAIVSRELGIPCIVNVKNATKVLKDNIKITVDGDYGKIFIKS